MLFFVLMLALQGRIGCAAGRSSVCFDIYPYFVSGLLRVAMPMQCRIATTSLPMPKCFDLMDRSFTPADSS